MSGKVACRSDDDGGEPAAASTATIARRAGLVVRADDRPGIRRRRAGRGFTYLDGRSRRVGGDRRRWIESLAIPPAWTDVWISPEVDSHLLATGIDAAGRKQYLYHPEWIEAANAAKFERLAGFADPLTRLRAHVAELLGRTTDHEWVCAAIVRLIDDSLIRPGSFRRFRSNGSVGATTLQRDHVSVSRRRLRLRFEGKGAIEQEIEVTDPQLARRVSDLLDRADDPGALFVDDDGCRVGVARLNRFIATHADPAFSAKDLRTWGATCLTAEHLMTSEDDESQTGAVRQAIERVADRLGNTVAVCRSSYVAPAVVEAYHDGRLAEIWRRSRRTRWLSRSEQTVRRVLAIER